MNNNLGAEIAKKLKILYEEEEGGRRLFDWLANRTNDVAETSIERVCQMADMTRLEAIELGKSLAEIGICDFVVGRKGWKSRIRWHYSVRSLGQAAKGKTAKIEEIDPELTEDVDDQQGGTVETEVKQEQALTLADAKRGLALTFGVKPEAIEITIKG